MDDEDKQVNNLFRHAHLTDHETSRSSASYLLSSFQQILPSGLQLQTWKWANEIFLYQEIEANA